MIHITNTIKKTKCLFLLVKRHGKLLLSVWMSLALAWRSTTYQPIDYNSFHQVVSSTEVASIATRTSSHHRPLPTPILVLGLPKTGTSSIHAFFQRSGYSSSHYKCNVTTSDKEQHQNVLFCGMCIKQAIKDGHPPLKSCGNTEVWTQLDVEQWGACHFPQITDLLAFHKEAPQATLILSQRNVTRWMQSVFHWGGMARRIFKACQPSPKKKKKWKKKQKQPYYNVTPFVGPKTPSRVDFIQWYNDHLDRIRQFGKDYPSHTLIEIDIEDPATPQRMASLFGSKAEFFGHENDSLKKNASTMTARVV